MGMSPERRANWARTRSRGKWRFVLGIGVAWWATFMFVATTVVEVLRGHSPWNQAGFRAVTWLIGGLLFGLGLWGSNERDFEQSAPADEASAAPAP